MSPFSKSIWAILITSINRGRPLGFRGLSQSTSKYFHKLENQIKLASKHIKKPKRGEHKKFRREML